MIDDAELDGGAFVLGPSHLIDPFLEDSVSRISVFVVVACLTSAALAEEYRRPELLVEPSELVAWLDDPHPSVPTTLIDVRPAADWEAATLPGAEWIDIGDWKRAFGEGTDRAGWTERIRRSVSSPEARVVVFDNAFTPNAARAWWILRFWGVEDVRVLNGGVKACRAAGLPVEPRQSFREQSPSTFVAKPHQERLATRAEMLSQAADANLPVCLIDTRSGTEVAAGVIPTAAHADWVRFVDPATGKIRSADELAALLDEAGFDPDEPAIAYCRSGGRASVVAFAMELMGGRKVANYFGSWNDWTSDPAAPVAELGVTVE